MRKRQVVENSGQQSSGRRATAAARAGTTKVAGGRESEFLIDCIEVFATEARDKKASRTIIIQFYAESSVPLKQRGLRFEKEREVGSESGINARGLSLSLSLSLSLLPLSPSFSRIASSPTVK